MPAVSERQRRFMGAELSRHRRGKKIRTDMSEAKLEDFASKSMGDVMEKNVVKVIDKYLGKTDKDFKTALDAFSTKPKTPKEAGAAVAERRKFDEAAAKITPPKRVIAKENDYPTTKGERRSVKRRKAKEMKITGAGTKNLQRIIGQKAEAVSGVTKQQEGSVIKAITSYMKKSKSKTGEKSIIKAISIYLMEKDGKYTHEEAKAAFDRDAAKVMGARQQKRDAELRRERGLSKKSTDIDKEVVSGTCGGGATTTASSGGGAMGGDDFYP